MTKVILLEVLKKFTEQAIQNILLPTRAQKGDVKSETDQKIRAAEVYKMRLPDSSSASKKAPYIIHQIITGKDTQKPQSNPSARTVVRSIFCVYCDNEEEGALMLLNLMERLRIELMKNVVLSKQFELDLDEGVEMLIYPDDTAPYYMGEMLTNWKMPAVEREVIL